MCGNRDFYDVVMTFSGIEILQFNQNRKSDKTPSIIYLDLTIIIIIIIIIIKIIITIIIIIIITIAIIIIILIT